MHVPTQAGALIDEIASNRTKPILQLGVRNHMCQCAAWGLLQPHEMQRLAQEGRVDREVADMICKAVLDIGDSGAKREVKAALPSTYKATRDTYFQIQVR